MPPKEKRWVFWDLDGTLVDTVPALYAAYAEFLRRRGVSPSRGEFEGLNGPTFAQIVRTLKTRHGLKGAPDALLKDYWGIAARHYGQAKAMPGAARALEFFRKKGIRSALVTSAPKAFVAPLLAGLGWKKHFEAVVCGDSVKKGKPFPEIYLEALKRTGAEAALTRVVEDSANGARSARAAGLSVLGVASGRKAEALRAAGAEETAPSLPEARRRAADFFRWHRSEGLAWSGGTFRIALKKKHRGGKKELIFTADRVDRKGGAFFISGRFIRYAEFQRARRDRKNTSSYRTLAVSGIAVRREGGKTLFLLGRRSRKVAVYRGHWELAPSGGIDAGCLSGRRVDFLRQVLLELKEEAGFAASQVRRVKAFILIKDFAINAYDIGCEIVLSPGTGEPQFNPEEYSEMRFAGAAQARRLLAGKAVPTSRILFEEYQRKTRGSS